MVLLKNINSSYIIKSLIRLTLILFLISCALFFGQDYLIFHGVNSFFRNNQTLSELPKNIESLILNTNDGYKLEAWKAKAPNENIKTENQKVILFFHGNSGTIRDFFYFQDVFLSQNITSYTLDYRGYGKSEGWPTEKGIYEDAETLYRFVSEVDHIKPENIIIIGYSIGSAPASYLASKIQPNTLILLAPFSNLKNHVYTRPFVGFFYFLLKFTFPNEDYVATLKNTNFYLIHGDKDFTIPFEESETLLKAYTGTGKSHLYKVKNGTHGKLLWFLEEKLQEMIR